MDGKGLRGCVVSFVNGDGKEDFELVGLAKELQRAIHSLSATWDYCLEDALKKGDAGECLELLATIRSECGEVEAVVDRCERAIRSLSRAQGGGEGVKSEGVDPGVSQVAGGNGGESVGFGD